MNPSRSPEAGETENPELLEALAYEHDAKAATLRAEAKRLRANVAPSPAQSDKPRQLKPEVYAQQCGVCVTTVHRWRADGMPTVPVSKNQYRVVARDADEWRRNHAAQRVKRASKPVGDSAVNVTDVLGTGLRLAGGAR